MFFRSACFGLLGATRSLPPSGRSLFLACLPAALGLLACGEPQPPPAPSEGATASPTGQASELSGVYEVQGYTVQAAERRQRLISGTVALRAEGDHFNASFELETSYPGDPGGRPARVTGTGQGYVLGEYLTGMARTDLMSEEGPEQTSGAAKSPLLIISTTRGTLTRDGRLRIRIQNEPGPGQDYSPSITVVEGTRVGPLRTETDAP